MGPYTSCWPQWRRSGQPCEHREPGDAGTVAGIAVCTNRNVWGARCQHSAHSYPGLSRHHRQARAPLGTPRALPSLPPNPHTTHGLQVTRSPGAAACRRLPQPRPLHSLLRACNPQHLRNVLAVLLEPPPATCRTAARRRTAAAVQPHGVVLLRLRLRVGVPRSAALVKGGPPHDRQGVLVRAAVRQGVAAGGGARLAWGGGGGHGSEAVAWGHRRKHSAR